MKRKGKLKMKRWWVISKEYGEVVPILDDGSGPMEYGQRCSGN
jgi:hypothetical protein